MVQIFKFKFNFSIYLPLMNVYSCNEEKHFYRIIIYISTHILILFQNMSIFISICQKENHYMVSV